MGVVSIQTERSVKTSMRFIILLTVFATGFNARRYRACDEGCCVHEYCAYHRICYPRIHCGLGCPDGHCVGQQHEKTDSSQHKNAYRAKSELMFPSTRRPGGNVEIHKDPLISERYSYNDKTVTAGSASDRELSLETDDINVKAGKSQKVITDHKSGMCMPFPPCKEGEFCGLGHRCSFNYNLGYHTCQYNLEIGATLCYDRKGKPMLQPLS